MDIYKKKQKLNNIIRDELPTLVSLIEQSREKALWNQLTTDLLNLENLATQAFNLSFEIKKEMKENG